MYIIFSLIEILDALILQQFNIFDYNLRQVFSVKFTVILYSMESNLDFNSLSYHL